MKLKFNKDDLGKRVLLELDIEKDPFAKVLGASKITISGEIIGIGETSFKIKADIPDYYGNCLPPHTPEKTYYAIYGSSKKRIKTIEYDTIKEYKFYQ